PGLQGTRRPDPSVPSRPALRARRPVAHRAGIGLGDVPFRGDEASQGARGGRAGRVPEGGAREAPLPEPGSHPGDPRPVDPQVPRASCAGAQRVEERTGGEAMSDRAPTTQVYRVFIKASPEQVWDAITQPEWTVRYGYGGTIEYDPGLQAGASYRILADEKMQAYGMPEVLIVGEVIEADAPNRLALTWHAQWEAKEGPTRLTYEIGPWMGDTTSLTVTHELDEAPGLAEMVAGGVEGAGGGWAEVLSDLKSLLATGEPLYVLPDPAS